MTLSQPFQSVVEGSSGVLFVGAGGGYDLFGAVPLALDRLLQGAPVHFAGVTFTNASVLPGARPHAAHPALYAVTGAQAVPDRYCPEAWLARWLEEAHGYREPIWLLKKTGVVPARAAYQELVNVHRIDTVVLVDGGVDVLLKGNEASIGTPVEDLCSLAALHAVEVPRKLVASIGFGSELRDGIRHAQVLERMSELTAAGAFCGTAALCGDTDAGRAYRSALDFVRAQQPGQKHSHVHHVVSSALEGRFGGEDADVWISPLSALCWFFELAAVARTHIFLPHLAHTESVFEVTAVVRECRKTVPARPANDIPL